MARRGPAWVPVASERLAPEVGDGDLRADLVPVALQLPASPRLEQPKLTHLVPPSAARNLICLVELLHGL